MKFLPFLVAAWLLLATVSARAQSTKIPAEFLPAMDVPKMSTPPKIDGHIDETEWRESSAWSGLASQNPGGNLLIPRPTTYFVGWDKDNLYIGMRTWIMPGYKPHVGGRGPGEVTAFDDGLEFVLTPQGKNVAPGRAGSSYKFFVSALGNTGDVARVSVGQLFRNWTPEIRAVTGLSPIGSAPRGGRWLDAEIALPAREFELNGPNRAGDVWRALLGFNHIPAFTQATIPINSAYFDASGHATLRLVENEPAVQMRFENNANFFENSVKGTVRVYNPRADAATVALSLVARQEKTEGATVSMNDLFAREETLTVPAGESRDWKIDEALPDMGDNRGFLGVRASWTNAPQGARELLTYGVYARQGNASWKAGYGEQWIKYTPPKEAFPLTASFNPVRNRVRLAADSYYLERPETARDASFTLMDESGKVLYQNKVDKTALYYFNDVHDLPDLKAGKYRVAARLDLKEGTTLGPVESSFVKLDEKEEFGAWWNNKLGDTERLIAPFTALKQDGNAVAALGRNTRFTALGLPQQIASNGGTVLAAPARIVIVRDGRETRVPLDGTAPVFDETKPWRIGFRGTATGGGLKFSVTGKIEQDGLTQLALTYAPLGDEPVTVDALRLEWPVRGDVAQSLVAVGPGGNFASFSAQTLPTKTGKLWDTLDLGKGGSGMTQGSFYPQIWLGNEKRGLLWWADSDEGWMPDDAIPAHEIVREKDGAVVLRNNLIGKRANLKVARTVNFTYNASPFKTMGKGWRMLEYSEDGTFEGPAKVREVDGVTIKGWNWLNPPAPDPKDWSALWAQFKPIADKRVRDIRPFDPALSRNRDYVHTSVPLSGYGPLTSDAKVAGYFAEEWDQNTFGKSQRDFTIWLLDRAIREGGLRTTYWDIFYVTLFKSPNTGFGYALPDGRIQPAFNGLNLRALMMRERSLMQDRGLLPGGIVTHATNNYPLIAVPWVDAILDGEWAEIRDDTKQDWVDFYAPEQLRAMSFSHNWGTSVSWMTLIHVSDAQRAAQLRRGHFDYMRLHDVWRSHDNVQPTPAILDWGLNDARVRQIPYWRNREIQTGDPEIMVSQWRLPDRTMLVIFNHHDQKSAPRDLNLGVDLKALGLSDKTIARALDDESAPRLDAATSSLKLDGLAPHTARVISLRDDDAAAVAQLQSTLQSFGGAAPDAETLAKLRDYGMGAAGLKFAKNPAQLQGANVQFALWRLPDRVIVGVRNAGDAALPDAKVRIDLDALKLAPQTKWQDFVRVRDFGATKEATQLDFYGRMLSLPNLAPGETRLIGVRRY